MDATLHALAGILLKAIPTFLLVIALHLYLKLMFFKPMEKMKHQRYEATEGARKLAEETLERVTAKTAEYEAAIRAARAEAYQAQERFYKELQEREAAELAAARQRAEGAIREARDMLAKDVAAAQASLGQESDALASKIADMLLRGSAAAV
jgi:F-type H+-transporting ATPase subunit b